MLVFYGYFINKNGKLNRNYSAYVKANYKIIKHYDTFIYVRLLVTGKHNIIWSNYVGLFGRIL